MYLFIGNWPASNNKLTSLALASTRPVARVFLIAEMARTALLHMLRFIICNLVSLHLLPNP